MSKLEGAAQDLKLALPEYSMSDDELMEFIYEAPRFATIASLRATGSPIVDGVGIEWDGEYVYFSVRNTRAMRKRLTRDPRVCIHVMNQVYPVRWARFEGRVEVIDDPDYERTLRIMHRYMDRSSESQELTEFDVEQFDHAYLAMGRTMYRLKPERIHTHNAYKQAERFELETGKLRRS